MRTLLAALALLPAAFLAGCSDDVPHTVLGDDVAPTPGAVAFHDCTEYDSAFPVPMSDVGAPEGFTLIPYDGSGQFATLLVWSNHCASAAVGAHPLSVSGEMWGLLAVQPPAEYENASVGAYALVLGVFNGDPLARHTYQSWGLEAVLDGRVAVETMTTGPTSVGRALASSPNFTVEVAVTAGGPWALGDGGAMRWFFTDGTNVTGALDNVFTAFRGLSVAGPAAFQETPGAEPLPTMALPGTGSLYAGFSYENRRVELGPGPGHATPQPAQAVGAQMLRHLADS